MKKNTGYVILAFLLFIVLVAKLFIVLQNPTPSYDAYYGLRYIEFVHENHVPMIFDEYSYQGRVSTSNMVFYLALSLLTFFVSPIFFFKIGSILIGVAVLYFIYKLVYKITKKPLIAILTTILGILTPNLFVFDLNTFTSMSVFLFLYVAILYFYSEIETTKGVGMFISCFILVTLISSYSLLLVLGFIVYVLLLRIEGFRVRRVVVEILLFSILFTVWYHFVFYKKALMIHGLDIISRSLPAELFAISYQQITPIIAMLMVGILPLVLGLFGMYNTLFEERNKTLLLMTSFIITFLFALWFRLIPLKEGILLITITLVLQSGNTLDRILNYLKKTFLSKYNSLIVIGIVLLGILGFVPVVLFNDNIVAGSPSYDQLQTLHDVDQLIPNDATLFGDVRDGHFISYMARRKNFYDENYFLMFSSKQRYADARKMFLSQSMVTVIDLMEYYDIDYVYVNDDVRKKYDLEKFSFEISSCFEKIYSTNTTVVYERKCGK